MSHFAKNKHVEFESKYNSKSSVLYNFNVNLKDIKSIKNKGNYFLFYGRLSREKGISTLIDAAINANIKLKVVGEGLLLSKYKKLKHKNIEFLGFKSGAELWSLIYNSSFVVVPSEWYENNPLTIIEAYSFGKPVIGARIGGIPEIIKENITGYLFPSGDKKKLEKLLIDANRLSDNDYMEMAKNARRFAETNFSAESYYSKLITLYNNIIVSKKQI